jgi:hypothetical protein
MMLFGGRMGHRGKLSRKEDKKGYDCDIQIKMKHFEPFRAVWYSKGSAPLDFGFGTAG